MRNVPSKNQVSHLANKFNPKSYLDTVAPKILPRVLEEITRSIREKSPVYISYMGGTHSDSPRKIQPMQIVCGMTGEQKVVSHCFLVNAKREFYLHKIQRIEDHDWQGQAQGKYVTSIPFLFCYSSLLYTRDCSTSQDATVTTTYVGRRIPRAIEP